MQPVTLARRLAATFYDLLLCIAVCWFAGMAAVMISAGGDKTDGFAIEPGTLWYQLYMLAIVWVFYVFFWARHGQTLGMKTWKFKVVTTEGTQPNILQASMRFFATFISLVPLGMGFWWALLEPDYRCWHDRLSGTKLIRVDAKK